MLVALSWLSDLLELVDLILGAKSWLSWEAYGLVAKCTGGGIGQTEGQISALPPVSAVPLGRFLNFSVLCLLICKIK